MQVDQPETLQQQVLDAVHGVVRVWVIDEKGTGDSQLDAALQLLAQRYRLWGARVGRARKGATRVPTYRMTA
jgi:hypothetical protein